MDRDIVVTLRGGSYFLDKTIVFRLVDSGKDDFKVIYRNYPGFRQRRFQGNLQELSG
jgi:hypothetical protein